MMSDKAWMLNPKAIRQAKQCIHLVKEATGVKLKLSQPEFMPLLHDYVQSSNSSLLADAYTRLIAMAGAVNAVHSLDPAFDAAAATLAHKHDLASV